VLFALFVRSTVIFIFSILWPQAVSILYEQNDLRLSAKLVPSFEDIKCCMVTATDPYDRIPGCFLDWSGN
jgi:hypothetical protein